MSRTSSTPSALSIKLDTYQRELISTAIRENGNDIPAAAKELGVSASDLVRRAVRLNLLKVETTYMAATPTTTTETTAFDAE
jgi:transcriptional regulator with GAF, ATPase, and Fis domain